jgi:putative colanic acid biosynthesis acetyltransferase WcaF
MARLRSSSTRREKLRRVCWSMARTTLFHFSPHNAYRFRATLLRAFGASVGSHCTIRRTAVVYYPWNLTMGKLSALGDHAVVYNLARVTIGDRVTVSQEVYLCAGTHDYRSAAMPLVTRPILIGDDAWICARAFVGPGVTVGEGAILGAAAATTHDLQPWTIYAGNPAAAFKTRPRLTAPPESPEVAT